MIILPAIDIKNRQCVRLLKGAFNTKEIVADDPLDTAMNFRDQGAEWLHMVDLDGALSGKLSSNKDIFIDVAKKSKLKVQLGGGIRSLESILYYLENGIERVVLGSSAAENPQLVIEALEYFGDRIAVGIDAMSGNVKISGWLKDSQWNYIDFAKKMEGLGVKTIIYTDISRDGTLKGPNLEHLSTLKQLLNINLIASGGIHTIEDINALQDLGLYGAICGKSLYKGTLSLRESIIKCKSIKR